MTRATGEEETFEASKADSFPSNEKGLQTNDHCALIHLNEPCVLENTNLRFNHDRIMTVSFATTSLPQRHKRGT